MGGGGFGCSTTVVQQSADSPCSLWTFPLLYVQHTEQASMDQASLAEPGSVTLCE